MRLLLAACLAALVAAPSAAEGASSVVVASRDGVELLVRDGEKGQFCTTVRVSRNRSTGCGPAPLGRMSAQIDSVSEGGRDYATGVVPALDTAEVELEYPDGARVRTPVVTGDAYQGRYAGRLRFFVVETTAAGGGLETPPVLLRRFNAAGVLVGAAAGDSEAPVAPPVTILRGKGVRVSVRAQRHLAPSPLQLDRTTLMYCLSIQRITGGSGTCAEAGPYVPQLSIDALGGCRNRGIVISGFTSPRVVKLAAVLGSGRRVTYPTRDISAVTSTLRVVAAFLPRGEALRRVTGLAADGSVVAEQPMGAPPAAGPCDTGSSSSYGLGFVEPGDIAPAPADGQQAAMGAAPGPQLLVRDDGDLLCFGVDRIADDGRHCRVPPVEEDLPLAATNATDGYTAAGGVAPPNAAAVRVEFGNGRVVTADVSDGPGYTGRYRGHVRFFLAQLPGRHRVTGIRSLDARGRVLSSFPGPDQPPPRTTTLRRGRGYRVFGARYDFTIKLPGRPVSRTRGACIGLAFGSAAPAPDACGSLADEPFIGHVDCRARQGLMVGRLAKGLRGVELTLAGGGRLASRAIPVPKRFGGGRLWLIEIPSRARVTHMRFLGRRPQERFGPPTRQSGPYPLPAPRSQCGYGLPEPTF